MNHTNDGPETDPGLRQRAEAMTLRKYAPSLEGLETLSPEETRRTVHELHVHQIELELQNGELRRAQAEVDALRARYFDLYDLAPVGYCTLSQAGLILETNLTAVALLDTTRSELVKQPFTRFILNEDQDIYYLHHKQLWEMGEPHACELRMVKKGGTAFWVHLEATTAQDCSTSPGPDGNGAPVSRVVLSDITERKQVEEEKAQLETQLQQTQKLETIGALAAGVAHDFNNLLTTVLSSANLGNQLVKPDSNESSLFQTIEKAATRATHLTRQLLTYAGKGKCVVTEVDLGIIVKEIAQILTVTIPSNVSLHFEPAAQIPFVKGDSTQLFQVVLNLITNASEAFTEDTAGFITVRTGLQEVDEVAIASGSWVLPVTPGHYVSLEVTDTGTGMTPEVMARVFDPFFTTKTTGHGLGLAAVIGILSSHGAGLRVRTEPGHGTSFKIYLPAMPGPIAISTGEPVSAWRGQGRLLVVDDEQAERTLVRQMAEQIGFSVIEAPNGLEAIELFRLHHRDLVLVLMDFNMPRMGGTEAFREMRKIDSNIPVLLSSGYDLLDKGLLLEGLAGFLPKPFHMAELRGLLQRTLT